jgi:hypothetical protein
MMILFPGEGRGPVTDSDWTPAFAGEQPVLGDRSR